MVTGEDGRPPEGSVLVTGARGFLGPVVVRRLRERGWAVVEYNREPAEDPGLRGYRVVQGELDDLPHLARVLAAYDVRRLVHLAAQSHPDVSLEAPLGTLRANVMGTGGVLEMARAAALDRVVLIGSESAYGATPGVARVSEDTPFRPTTPYGVSKAAVDWLAEVYRTRFHLDVVVLRIGQIYGPGQRLPEDVHDLIRQALDHGAIRLAAGADQEVELIHVEDAADAVVRAVQVDAHDATAYNVSGWQTTLGAVAGQIARVVQPLAVEIGPGRKGYDRRAPFDGERAARELGFRPRIALEDGIRTYVDWLRTHAD